MTASIRSLTILAAIVALLFVPNVSLAQRDAGAKARGDYSGTFWSTKSATRSTRHARDYSVDTHQYLRATPKPSAAHVRAESKEIGKNIAAAKAEATYLTKNAAQEDAKAVASILSHLKAAEEEHTKLEACCATDDVKADEAMACSTAISDHLKKAHDELETLEKKLTPKATAPKK
jgi:hypothetical protein